MRVFLSYRRDDTAGRTGRLFDALVARLGQRNVFQDVGSIEPGVDFEEAVRSAITTSDATLVVIGPEWATIRDPAGLRRLDDPDDYVRREVSTALAAGGTVVPVLVGEAALPDVDELPDDLQPLVQRQAVELRDATWHDDLDGLMRRLHGDMASGRSKSRRRVVVIGVVIAAAAAAGGVWLLGRDHSDSSAGEPELPPCSVPDATWTSLDVPATATATYDLDDAEHHRLRYTVQKADAVAKGPVWEIILQVEQENLTTPIENTFADDSYFSRASLKQLFVDGVSQDESTCFSVRDGDKEVTPGKRAISLFGFQSSIDPSGVSLELITSDDRSVVITG
jgi:hypothetical protein